MLRHCDVACMPAHGRCYRMSGVGWGWDDVRLTNSVCSTCFAFLLQLFFFWKAYLLDVLWIFRSSTALSYDQCLVPCYPSKILHRLDGRTRDVATGRGSGRNIYTHAAKRRPSKSTVRLGFTAQQTLQDLVSGARIWLEASIYFRRSGGRISV